MNLEQLRALRAIVDEGSFEGAAHELGVSPSAVSQRIRALERAVGQVVVRRGTPCRPTDAGAHLVRVARHMQVLEDEAWAGLGRASAGRSVTALAVPADVLGTWFTPVLRDAADWEDTVLDLRIEDQDHSAALLRRGEVLAAVTSDPQPVPGCVVEPLGALRYVPVASPELLRRHGVPVPGSEDAGSAGATPDDAGPDDALAPALARLPVLRFNAKDDLQRRVLRRHAPQADPPTHTAPSFEAFHRCVSAGLGWGMLVDAQAAADLRTGRLVRLPGAGDVLVPLHWQAVTLPAPRLVRLADRVRAAAADALEPA